MGLSTGHKNDKIKNAMERKINEEFEKKLYEIGVYLANLLRLNPKYRAELLEKQYELIEGLGPFDVDDAPKHIKETVKKLVNAFGGLKKYIADTKELLRFILLDDTFRKALFTYLRKERDELLYNAVKDYLREIDEIIENEELIKDILKNIPTFRPLIVLKLTEIKIYREEKIKIRIKHTDVAITTKLSKLDKYIYEEKEDKLLVPPTRYAIAIIQLLKDESLEVLTKFVKTLKDEAIKYNRLLIEEVFRKYQRREVLPFKDEEEEEKFFRFITNLENHRYIAPIEYLEDYDKRKQLIITVPDIRMVIYFDNKFIYIPSMILEEWMGTRNLKGVYALLENLGLLVSKGNKYIEVETENVKKRLHIRYIKILRKVLEEKYGVKLEDKIKELLEQEKAEFGIINELNQLFNQNKQ